MITSECALEANERLWTGQATERRLLAVTTGLI